MMKLGKIPFKRKEDESFLNLLDLSEAKGKGLDGFREIMNQKYYHKIAGAISKNIPNRFHKIVFCSPGLSLCDNLKLVFSLGQSPFVAPFIPSCRTPIKKNLRNNIKVSEETDEFESILNDLVAEQLPISFFEGYLAMRNKSLEVYPKRTKVICTANKMTFDEGFRFWVANQVEKGAKLVLIQHGGGYGLYSTFWEKHELKICDKFFSWGWGREQLKVSPMTTPMPHMKHNKRSDPTGPILWAENGAQAFIIRTDNVAAGNFDHKFRLQQKRFVNAICSEARKLLLVRLYIVDYGLNEKERLKDMYPSLKFARKGGSLVQALRGSRLCVHGYFGTTWLETLSINFPTVVYWDLNRVHTLASVQPYLDDLRRVKILHDTPESAAEFINKVYEDPLLWWMSSELQQVKDKFCHLFARTSKNWLKEWKEELLKMAEI